MIRISKHYLKTGNLAETNFTKQAGKGGVMNWTSAYIQAVATLSSRQREQHLEHHLWNDSNFEGPLVAFYTYFDELEA